MSQPVQCELCQVTLDDPEEFIGHCRKDPIHLALQTKFTDETYDFLFDESQFGELSGGQGLQANPSSTTGGPSTTMISTTGNQNNNHNNHSQRGGSSYGGGGGYGGYGGRSNYNNSNYNNGGGHQHNQRY